MKRTIHLALAAVATAVATSAQAQEASAAFSRLPDIHGTLRAKYEYEPDEGAGRFEVRNARVSVEGAVVTAVRYKAEIDLSDEGSIKMLDAYVRLQSRRGWRLTAGQMRVPYSIDAPRSPHQQWFANRSFIAKQVGNVRDVGAVAAWTHGGAFPLTLEGGLFNGSGLTSQKDYWTKSYNYALKAQAGPFRGFTLEASVQRAKTGDTRVMMYDGGAYWEGGRWHVEAEYMRKRYAHGAFSGVDAVDAFAAWRMPLRRLEALTFLCRYDYMSDHSDGEKDADTGLLTVDDPGRHRITGGVTLSVSRKPLQADVRLNYEHYFYHSGVEPAVSEQSKLVAELVVHF